MDPFVTIVTSIVEFMPFTEPLVAPIGDNKHIVTETVTEK